MKNSPWNVTYSLVGISEKMKANMYNLSLRNEPDDLKLNLSHKQRMQSSYQVFWFKYHLRTLLDIKQTRPQHFLSQVRRKVASRRQEVLGTSLDIKSFLQQVDDVIDHKFIRKIGSSDLSTRKKTYCFASKT